MCCAQSSCSSKDKACAVEWQNATYSGPPSSNACWPKACHTAAVENSEEKGCKSRFATSKNSLSLSAASVARRPTYNRGSMRAAGEEEEEKEEEEEEEEEEGETEAAEHSLASKAAASL